MEVEFSFLKTVSTMKTTTTTTTTVSTNHHIPSAMTTTSLRSRKGNSMKVSTVFWVHHHLLYPQVIYP
jgi:hypothetical protein